MSPTYIVIFAMYSVLNVHDVSWGSRPASGTKEDDVEQVRFNKKREIQYTNYRANFFMLWVVLNVVVGFTISQSFKGNL